MRASKRESKVPMKVCSVDEHLVVDVQIDLILQKYRHNLFVGGLLWHAVKTSVLSYQKSHNAIFVCKKKRDVKKTITRNVLHNCTKCITLQMRF